MYSPIAQEHFAHPRNAGTMENPDVVAREGRPGEGNYMQLSLKVEGERITDARFLTYGCPAAIVSGSWLTEWVVGKTLAEAAVLEAGDIEAGLGGLPLGKEHCPALAVSALRQALQKLRSAGSEPPHG